MIRVLAAMQPRDHAYDRRNSAYDRQQVNARVRASACWIGGRRRPTRRNYAFTDILCKHTRRQSLGRRRGLPRRFCAWLSDLTLQIGDVVGSDDDELPPLCARVVEQVEL
jgi:hypothetical protein